jgi:hypothetical protein
MPFEQETFEFPDEKQEKPAENDFEIEVVDDTPAADRGRGPAAQPDEVSDDELSQYGKEVQARIKKATRVYHDERRAKEQAMREREAAETLARQVLEENRQLQEKLASGSKEFITQSQQMAEGELGAAKRAYREAYEEGDADKMVAAQEAIAKATLRIDKASTMKPLQVTQKEVQIAQQPRVDPKVSEWQAQNTWFGKNRSMTAFALGLHAELTEEQGVDPNSDRYYQEIDRTMRAKFPEHFGSQEEPGAAEAPAQRTKPANVVAPAARSTPPNRIKLTASEVAIAKRLGVPLELYAKKVAELKNGAQNG